MATITLNHLRKKASSSPSHPLLTTFLTCYDHVKNHPLFKPKYDKNLDQLTLKHLHNLHTQGYSTIPNYINRDQCALYRNEIDTLISQHTELLHRNIDDQRIYGVENISEQLKSFSKDPFLQEVATAYNQIISKTAFTLAARLPFSPGNIGSGGGWHRDSCIKQIKAILYLSDVDEENGPFQLIEKSHTLKNKLLDGKITHQPYMGYRFTQEQVEKILSKEPKRAITFAASAGTLILVDTSCIHRGKPILKGCRHALFNYYYPTTQINAELFRHFSPMAQ